MPKLKLGVKGEYPKKEEIIKHLKENLPNYEISTHFFSTKLLAERMLLVKSPENIAATLVLNYEKKRIDLRDSAESFSSMFNYFKWLFRLATYPITMEKYEKLLSEIHRALYPKYVINEPLP